VNLTNAVCENFFLFFHFFSPCFMELMILPFSATEKNIPPNGKCQALDWYFFRKKCAVKA